MWWLWCLQRLCPCAVGPSLLDGKEACACEMRSHSTQLAPLPGSMVVMEGHVHMRHALEKEAAWNVYGIGLSVETGSEYGREAWAALPDAARRGHVSARPPADCDW